MSSGQFIAILGPACAGKTTLADHLVKDRGYTRCSIDPAIPLESTMSLNSSELSFRNSSDLLNFATAHWRRDFVTTDLNQKLKLQEFTKRPFVVVIDIQAPLGVRWRRQRSRLVRS